MLKISLKHVLHDSGEDKLALMEETSSRTGPGVQDSILSTLEGPAAACQKWTAPNLWIPAGVEREKRKKQFRRKEIFL